MRRWLSLIAVTLGLAVGVVAITPPGDASALACTSSVSPSCQPANLPILIEAGVVTAPNIAGSVGTSTVAVVAKGSSGTIWGSLRTAVGGFLGITTAIDMFGENQVVDGGLSSDGVVAQRIATDLSVGGSVMIGDKICTGSGTTERCIELVNSGAGGVAGWTGYAFLRLNPFDGQAWLSWDGVSAGNQTLAGYTNPWCAALFSAVHVASGLQLVCAQRSSASPLIAYGFSPTINTGTYPVATGGPVTGTAKVTLKCQNAAGVIREVVASLVQTFVAGQPMTVPDTQCAPDELAVGADIDWLPETGPAQRIVEDDGTQLLPSQKELQTLYPGCFGPGVTGCVMVLDKLNGQTCGLIGELCEDWASDPNRDSVYRCRYGQTVILLAHCSAYRMPSAGVLPNVDQNGNLLDPSAPVPGIQTPRQPGTAPGTAPAPVPGESPDCRPASWWEVLTPWWAFKAMQCAVVWAVAPSPQKVADARERIKMRFNMSAPGRISTAISTALIGLEMPTGCEGIMVPLDWMKQGAFSSAPFPNNFRMLNACPGDVLHPWAVFSSLVVSAGLVFVAFKTLPSLLGKIFTYTGIDG